MASVILEYFYTFVTCFLLAFFLKKTFKLHTFSKKYFILWAFFGFIFGIYSFSWLYTVYPLPWLAPGLIQIVGLIIIHLLLALLCALSYSFVAFSFHPRIHKKFQVLAFGVFLSITEIIRSLFLSALFSGNGGSVGLHWTASTIGNALSTTPLIEFAYFGGTYGLTCILGIIIYTWTSSLSLKKKCGYSLIILVGLFCIHVFIPVSGPERPLTIGVITTNFPNPRKEDEGKDPFPERFNVIHEMTKIVATSTPDIVVYPEDTRYSDYLSGLTKTELLSLYRDTLFIDGSTRKEGDRLSNYTLFYNPDTAQVIGRGKGFLFPFSEYIPSLFTPIFSLFVGKDAFQDYLIHHTYTPQSLGVGYLYDTNTVLSTIICSEILSFQIIHEIKKQHPSIVFFQSQLSVFNKHPLSMAQLRSDTKIAAAQLRTPIISSSNAFESYIVSPYGSIIDTLPAGFNARTYIVSKESIVLEEQ